MWIKLKYKKLHRTDTCVHRKGNIPDLLVPAQCHEHDRIHAMETENEMRRIRRTRVPGLDSLVCK